jgi:hypothetical protein
MEQEALAHPVRAVEEAAGADGDQLVEAALGVLPAGGREAHRAVGEAGPTARAPEGLEASSRGALQASKRW